MTTFFRELSDHPSYMFIFSLSIKAFGKNAIYAYAGNEDPGPLCAYAQSEPVSAFASRYNARISFPTATKSSSRSRGASLLGLDYEGFFSCFGPNTTIYRKHSAHVFEVIIHFISHM